SHGPCGWLKDRFGVSWQVTPTRLDDMIADLDPARAERAMKAMLGMQKLDLAELEKAYAGG
ncbi:VOC family protein, partial [Streptomyces sp. S12]|nr:VOC family protein [Streptomyces sp. S12]